MLIRPLIVRELLRECRRKWHFLGRTLFVLLLSVFVITQGRKLLVTSPAAMMFRGGPGMRMSAPATLGTVRMGRAVSFRGAGAAEYMKAMTARYGAAIFRTWALLQYIALVLLATVRSAALAGERRYGSLALVRTTAIGDSGIIYGWFASVMGRTIFTMLLALPVLTVSQSLGGFTMGEAGWVCCVTLAAAAYASALTLMIASRSESTGAALSVSLAVQLVSLSFVPFGLFRFTGGRMIFENDWAPLHGMNVLGQVLSNVPNLRAAALSYVLTRFVLGAVFIFLARAWLGKAVLAPTRPLKRLLRRLDGFFLNLSGKSQVLWAAGLGRCGDNPVLWRERAVSLIGQRDHLIRLVYGSFLLVVVASSVGLLVDWDASLWIVMAGMIGVPALLVAVLTVVPPAGTFARERRRGTLDLLAASPLRAGTIVWGKYLFCLRGLLLPLALFGAFMLGVIYVFNFGEWAQLARLAPLAVLSPMIIAMTIYVSAGSNDTGKALCASAAIVAALLLLFRGRMGFIQVLAMGNLSGMTLMPVVAVTLAAAFTMRSRRFGANVFLACAAPFLTLMFLGVMRLAAGWGHMDMYTVLLASVLICAIAFVAAAVSLWRRRGGWRGLVIMLACLLVLSKMQGSGRLAQIIFLASLGFLFLKGARYCGPSALARTVWVLLSVILVTRVLSFRVLMEAVMPPGYYHAVNPVFFVLVLAWGVVVSGAMSLMFLLLTARQLDDLMGRNG